MSGARRVAVLIMVAAVAAFFRLHQLDAIPPGLFIDEAQDGIDGAAIARGERFPLMVEVGDNVKARTREPIFFYLMAAVFRLFGPTVESLRLTSALIGIATVALFVLACEQWFGLQTACLAGLLLAVCRWHVTFSRIGLRAILAPLWIVLTVLAVRALVRRRSRPAAALCGATVALGGYTYQAYWIVPLPLMLLGLVQVWRVPRRALRAAARLAPMALGAFLLVGAPLIRYALARPDYYFARAFEVAQSVGPARSRAAELRDNLQKVLFMLHFRSQSPAQFGFPGRPLLDPLTGVAFAIGAFALLKTLRSDPIPKLGVLLFWVCPLLPATAGDMPQAVMRALGAAPAVCLIAAVGLQSVASAVESAGDRAGSGRAEPTPLDLPPWQGGRQWPRRCAAAVAALAIAAATGWNYHAYFREWAGRADVDEAYMADVRRFFDFFAPLAEANDVYVSPYVYYSPNVRFLNLARQAPLRLLAEFAALVASEDDVRDRVYISESPGLNALIEELYPEREIVARYKVYGRHGGRVYRVARSQLRVSLPPARRAEVAYWIHKMLADFRAQVRRW